MNIVKVENMKAIIELTDELNSTMNRYDDIYAEFVEATYIQCNVITM